MSTNLSHTTNASTTKLSPPLEEINCALHKSLCVLCTLCSRATESVCFIWTMLPLSLFCHVGYLAVCVWREYASYLIEVKKHALTCRGFYEICWIYDQNRLQEQNSFISRGTNVIRKPCLYKTTWAVSFIQRENYEKKLGYRTHIRK